MSGGHVFNIQRLDEVTEFSQVDILPVEKWGNETGPGIMGTVSIPCKMLIQDKVIDLIQRTFCTRTLKIRICFEFWSCNMFQVTVKDSISNFPLSLLPPTLYVVFFQPGVNEDSGVRGFWGFEDMAKQMSKGRFSPCGLVSKQLVLWGLVLIPFSTFF